MNTSSKVLAGLVIVLAIGFFIYWYTDNSSPSVTREPQDSTTDTTPVVLGTNPTTSSNDKYKDGTYNVVTSYISPGGKDELGVTITIKDDLVSAVTVKNMSGDSTSNMYQNRLIGGIGAAVVGKSVEALKVGVVSGASLASAAFNVALVQIKAQASL